MGEYILWKLSNFLYRDQIYINITYILWKLTNFLYRDQIYINIFVDTIKH